MQLADSKKLKLHIMQKKVLEQLRDTKYLVLRVHLVLLNCATYVELIL